ncbi:hypothetical protein [Streptomyces sp. C]|uniref:hypothetical protein n=1 Tax=Streptomyces sp. C TaxID=253839 RepID=UPI0001B50913|nr:hypothetical protein [Streptomyces sp. C]
MIIFDTNAVNLLPPSGLRADIIRKLRQSGHHKVAVPWMVMEELVAHQTKHYPDKYRAVVNTLAKLREALPWELKSSLEPLDLNRLVAHWRMASFTSTDSVCSWVPAAFSDHRHSGCSREIAAAPWSSRSSTGFGDRS